MSSAGCRTVELFDENTGRNFPVLVLYPSPAVERPEQLGSFDVTVAMHGPIAPGRFPLVVISHGSGGSHLLYHSTAAHLARNGFVVASLEHPGNSRNDNSLVDTVENLGNRPRHVRTVIDRAYSGGEFGANLVRDSVAIIGHSMGGYTALAIAGAIPTSFPRESPDRQPRRIEVYPDPRVKALVLLAPATAWFMAAGALKNVHLPILMFTGDQDEYTPAFHADLLNAKIPEASLIEHHVIANAGHFSFMSPFPPAQAHPSVPPSQDPPGFDRIRYHERMNTDILAFLKRILSPD